MELQNLNFLQYQEKLQLKTEKGVRYIYDPVRKKYLVLQPEELVRQLIIQHLVTGMDYPIQKIAVEIGLEVNGLAKRCDILIYNQELQPTFLIECKAPQVPINEAVFKQISTYNLTFKVPYLLVSNGIQSYCAQIFHQDERFEFLDEIPSYAYIK